MSCHAFIIFWGRNAFLGEGVPWAPILVVQMCCSWQEIKLVRGRRNCTMVCVNQWFTVASYVALECFPSSDVMFGVGDEELKITEHLLRPIYYHLCYTIIRTLLVSKIHTMCMGVIFNNILWLHLWCISPFSWYICSFCCKRVDTIFSSHFFWTLRIRTFFLLKSDLS